jgi:hypothetical protein
MVSKAKKLFDKAKRSQRGWNRKELDKLYKAHGFDIDTDGGDHDFAVHDDLVGRWGTLTRSSGDIHPDYVKKAIELIEELQKIHNTLQAEGEEIVQDE